MTILTLSCIERFEEMNIEHDPRLTSAEIDYLWGVYLNDSLSVCVFKYFLQHIEDTNIKTVVEHALYLSEQRIEHISKIFKEEEIQIPHGFTEEDVNLKAKRLYSDIFCLNYIKNLIKARLVTHATATPQIFRKDILTFNSKCLTSAIELNNETTEIMLEKGLAIRPPYIPYPTEIEFVHKQSFILEMLGKRPLVASEITNLYTNSLTNNIGSCLGQSFVQVAVSKDVRDFISRGTEIAIKHIKIFSDYLGNQSLPTNMPLSVSQDITESTESPFSDKLMMAQFGVMNVAGASNYGLSIPTSMRSDLVVDYSRLMAEVLKYAEDGQNIMIKNNWLERPPLASYREKD